jgi:hypothetical protein
VGVNNGFILVQTGVISVTKTTVKPTENLSWEALRRKADLLGVPAWKLAEELTFHETDGRLVFGAPLKS